MSAVCWLLVATALGCWAAAWIKQRRRGSNEPGAGEGMLAGLGRPLELYLDYAPVSEYLMPLMGSVHLHLARLGESDELLRKSRVWLRDTAAFTFAAIQLLLVGAAVSDDGAIAAAAAAAVVGVPVWRLKQLERRAVQRCRSIVMALPDFLNQLSLLMVAGDPLIKALHRITAASARQIRSKHPLYLELSRLTDALERQGSFPLELERFSRRCGVQEAAMLSTALLFNYRRGGEHTASVLLELGRMLTEKRKQAARTIGEQASIKLIFPMLLVFASVMLIVAYPAFTMLQQP